MPGILSATASDLLSRRCAVLWFALALAAALSLLMAGRTLSAAHIAASAERSAISYTRVIQAAVPGLRTLFEQRTPDPQTLAQLARLRHVDTVFRFKMFAADGALLLVSDQLDEPDFGADGRRLGDDHGTPKKEAAEVLTSGKAFVEFADGRDKPDRPDYYSEAYVPLTIGGETLGVIEVYVDQSALVADTRRLFAGIVAIGALVLALLGGLFLLKRRSDRRVRYLARYDALTGALNRTSFAKLLEQASSDHANGGSPFAVHYLDLDRFKDVNDTLGHAAGDEVLRQATERLRARLRAGDSLARLGGDEFAVLQRNVRDAGDVRQLGERLIDSLAPAYALDIQNVSCGCSAGAARYPEDAVDAAELMHRADLALYRAKADGRGRFGFYDEQLDSEQKVRRQLVADLRLAIDQRTLTVHYQKLFAADGVRITGREALARWHHPTHGNVTPDVFIPLAEKHGLIEALGKSVLQDACEEAAHWPDEQSVAVNLSPAQFQSGDLVETVRAALASSGLAAARLELEITESLLMRDTPRVLSTLEELAALGVRIAMDDFGTGHSSLAYLWRFPFDKLKIDRSFTQAIGADSRVGLIVDSIVSLAHALQIRVNAEGVETAAQLAQLQRHGCDEFQGFLLARPECADARDAEDVRKAA